MIEIYKKLPGTNCGECGVPTCIAFALKVTNSQLDIQKCPYISEGVKKLFSQDTSTTSDDNYERVSDELEKEARQKDFKEAAEKIGGDYEFRDRREIIGLKMINRHYEMRREGLFEDGEYSQDSWAKIIVYDYIRRQGRQPLTGKWVTLGYFPHTASHVKAFQSSAEKKIAETFNEGIDALKQRCKEFNGEEVRGKMKTDYTCRFNLLPRIPLYLCFWANDEEFDANCKLFVDSSAEDYIDIEYLAYLVERFIEEFVKK